MPSAGRSVHATPTTRKTSVAAAPNASTRSTAPKAAATGTSTNGTGHWNSTVRHHSNGTATMAPMNTKGSSTSTTSRRGAASQGTHASQRLLRKPRKTTLGLIPRAGLILLALSILSVLFTLRRAVLPHHLPTDEAAAGVLSLASSRSTTTRTTTSVSSRVALTSREAGIAGTRKPPAQVAGLIKTKPLAVTVIQSVATQAVTLRRPRVAAPTDGFVVAQRDATTKHVVDIPDLPSLPLDGTNLTHWQRALLVKQRALASMAYPTSRMFGLDAPVQLLRVHDSKAAPQRDPVVQPYDPNHKPTMAIITSTRSTANHTLVSQSLLVKHLMESVLRSVSEAERNVWNVHLYVAVDDTDAWWLTHWRDIPTSSWLKMTLGVFPDRGHHIPFNEIALVAYTEGADYFCRVNDDTEFKTTEWISHGVHALQRYNPPNVGVIGPKCFQGNTNIMTHDMVHRNHMDIFQGFYYPPAFGNWFLDDWISSVYAPNVVGPYFNRVTVLSTFIIKHWMYETRYKPDVIDSQWLPVEYERGRRLIHDFVTLQYPPKQPVAGGILNVAETPHPIEIATSLPPAKNFHPTTIAAVLDVLPKNGNLLIWGLDMDSHYWHRATTGRVVFVEDSYMRKRFQKFVWRDFVRKSYPYLEYIVVPYTTPRGKMEDSYQEFVVGQTLDHNTNWCDLQFAGFADSIYDTVWDVVLVAAPEQCSTLETCRDDDGPGIFQALHTTKTIVANQTARLVTANAGGNPERHVTHVFVDDYDRKYEKDFSKSLFAKEPKNVLTLDAADTRRSRKQAHYVFDVTDRIAQNIPYCVPPPIRDAALFPKDAELDAKQVRAILEVLPRAGNMLVWGLGPESIFWHKATQGRVVFLEDSTRLPMKDGKTLHFDYFTKKYPQLEAYQVTFSSENNDAYYNRFAGHAEQWTNLNMVATGHNFPDVVNKIAWHVILIDAPLGCCDLGPGRLQSIYMSKVLAETSQNVQPPKDASGKSESIVTHVFVDDYERKVESEFSRQVFDKSPLSVLKRGKTFQCAHYVLDKSDFNSVSQSRRDVATSSADVAQIKGSKSSQVERSRSAFPKAAQMGWNQVEKILAALPENGNLLIWGLGNDSPFWSHTTTGRVSFLEDGSWSTNLLDDGKRWFDQVTAAHPDLEAFTVDYTTKNNDATFRRYSESPERWASLEIKDGFPKSILETRWDVILVDAPLGYPDTGPGRYQSLYMTKLLAKSSSAANKKGDIHTVHVFVDDYERKIEREFSQQVFGKPPIEVITRVSHDDVPANKQAHFVFGLTEDTESQSSSKAIAASSDLAKKFAAVVREKSAFPPDAQMGWEQVKRILSVLPPDGNFLIWGLGNDSLFWSRTTTGKVIFLEDGSWSTNLVDGKRWFDLVTAKNPKLEAYAVDYTSTNSVSSYNRYSGHPEQWTSLEMKDNFPKIVLDTRWDVILVDAPLGFQNSGPGRYQSLYMSQLLAKKSESTPRAGMESVAEGGHALQSSAVHVFVDDYERKVEREFSQQVFGHSPVKVIKRRTRTDVPANEQAHFVFGEYDEEEDKTDDIETSSVLVPWSYPGAEEGQLSPPLVFPKTWVVLVEVNNGYYDFFLNWLYHYNELNLPLDVVVIAEDATVKGKLEKEVLPFYSNVLLERSGLSLGPVSLKYNTKEYKALVSARATHILLYLEKGMNVIYTDVDTVWRKSPLPFFAAADESADVVLQVDTAKFNGFSPYYCTGFMALVSNEQTIQLMSDWQQALTKAQLNQPVFNEILHSRSAVKHQPLPKAEFPSGEFYFKKFNDAMRAKAVVVHNNYIQGFIPKKQRFMQRGLWKLPEWKKSMEAQKASKSEHTSVLGRIGAAFTLAG